MCAFEAAGQARWVTRLPVPTRVQMGGTVFDMEEAELCYAPQVCFLYDQPG